MNQTPTSRGTIVELKNTAGKAGGTGVGVDSREHQRPAVQFFEQPGAGNLVWNLLASRENREPQRTAVGKSSACRERTFLRERRLDPRANGKPGGRYQRSNAHETA